MALICDNDNYSAPALVLGLSPTGLAVIESLGLHGIQVFGADFKLWELGRYSRFCQFDKELSLELRPGTVASAFLRFRNRFDVKPVVFVSDDHIMELVAKVWHEVEGLFHFATPLTRLTDSIIDKRRFYMTCQELSIQIPMTYFPDSAGEVRSVAKRLRYPVIIKPSLIHRVRHLIKGRKVLVATTPRELIRGYNALLECQSEVVVQEVIPGDESNIRVYVGYINDKGQVLESFTGTKLRQYPPRFGSASLATSCDDSVTRQLSEDILRRLGFRGIASTEFKVDPRDGGYKLMEINPRIALWYGLALRSGINVPLAAYRDLIGLPAQQGCQQDGLIWTYVLRDTQTALKYWYDGGLSIRDWLRSYSCIATDAVFPWCEKRYLALGVVYFFRHGLAFMCRMLRG